MRATWQFLKL